MTGERRDPYAEQLGAIERKLAELEATARLLWGLRLIADGHATDFRVARETNSHLVRAVSDGAWRDARDPIVERRRSHGPHRGRARPVAMEAHDELVPFARQRRNTCARCGDTQPGDLEQPLDR